LQVLIFILLKILEISLFILGPVYVCRWVGIFVERYTIMRDDARDLCLFLRWCTGCVLSMAGIITMYILWLILSTLISVNWQWAQEIANAL